MPKIVNLHDFSWESSSFTISSDLFGDDRDEHEQGAGYPCAYKITTIII